MYRIPYWWTSSTTAFTTREAEPEGEGQSYGFTETSLVAAALGLAHTVDCMGCIAWSVYFKR